MRLSQAFFHFHPKEGTRISLDKVIEERIFNGAKRAGVVAIVVMKGVMVIFNQYQDINKIISKNTSRMQCIESPTIYQINGNSIRISMDVSDLR